MADATLALRTASQDYERAFVMSLLRLRLDNPLKPPMITTKTKAKQKSDT
ncbi:MAG: hypothetical protein WBD20_17700 [Pirellulaceae bacterium]